jgi:hypothetical protein
MERGQYPRGGKRVGRSSDSVIRRSVTRERRITPSANPPSPIPTPTPAQRRKSFRVIQGDLFD